MEKRNEFIGINEGESQSEAKEAGFAGRHGY